MATEVPVVIDVTARNDGKAAAAFAELNKGVDRFSTSADKMVAGLDKVLKRLQEMEAAGTKAANNTARSLDQQAAAAERAAQRELKARSLAVKEARNSLLAEAQSRMAARDAEIKAENEKRAARRATAQASKETAAAEKAAAQASAAAAAQAVKAAKEQAAASAQAEKAASKLRAQMESSAQAMAVGLGAASLALGGLAGAVLSTANDFEVLLTRLQTVQGSAAVAMQTFNRSVEFAAKTPFDLKGVVDATVTLEVYGQRSQEILPRVAALAAGMGKDLQATALVVGKAMSGSLEGFESLRNEYGITTRELARFGAETLKTGGILTSSAASAEKARNALTSIIDARFGDALERQSQTTAAAIERIKDEIVTLAAEVGAGAAGVVKFVAGPISAAIGLFKSLPAPLKAAAGAGLAVGAAVTAIGAAGAVGAAGLLALNTQLVAAAAVMPGLAGAAAASTAAVTGMGAATSALSQVVATLAGPYGIALAAVSALAIGFGQAADAQKLLGKEMERESAQFQQRIQDYREIAKAARESANAEREARGEAPIPEGSQTMPGQTMAELKQLLDTASTSDFFTRFKQMGLDAEQTRAEIGKLGTEISAKQAAYDQLAQAQADIEKGLRDVALNDTDYKDLLGKNYGYKENQKQLRDSAFELNTLKEQESMLKLIDERYAANAKSMESVGQAAKSTQDYLKYAEQAGDLKTLNEAYGVSVQKLGQMGQALKALNQPTDRKSLLAELRTLPQDSPLRETISAYLDQQKQVTDQGKELAEKRAEGPKKEIEALRSALTERKSLQQASVYDELASLNQQLTIAQTLTHGKEAEITRIQNEQKQVRLRARKQEADEEKNLLTQQLNTAKAVPVAARSRGTGEDNRGTVESVRAYDTAIQRVQAYLAELNKLRAAGEITAKNFQAMGQAGRQALDQLQIARAADEAARLAKNLQEFEREFTDAFSGAETGGPAAQLAIVEDAITRAKRAQRDGSIETEAADRKLAELGRQRLGLEQTISQEKLRQAGEINQLEQAALQQEIDLLTIRKEQGFAVDAEILAKTEELHAKKLEALQNELDAGLKAAQDNADEKLHVQDVFNRKVAALEKERTTDFEREHVKRTSISANTAPQAQSRTSQGGSSASSGSSSQGSSGGPSSKPYESGIKTTGFSSREDYVAKREESRAEREAAQRAAFDRGNPGVLGAIRAQEIARTREQAIAAANRAKPSQAAQDILADRTKRQNEALARMRNFGDPSVPQGIADRASQVTQAGSAPAPTAAPTSDGKPAAGGTSQAVSQTVNDNRRWDVSISVDGEGTIDVMDPPPAFKRMIADIVKSEIRHDSYMSAGGNGPSF